MLKAYVFFPLCFFFMAGCSTPRPLATISISETNGLDRKIEYISAIIPYIDPGETTEVLMATDMDTGISVPVQIMDTLTKVDEKAFQIVFPVHSRANTSKTYQIGFGQRTNDSLPKILKPSEDMLSVENDIFKAVFSTEDDPRGGQIGGIILKDFDNQLLKRGHIAMHWAPNFSKSDSEGYFNFEDLPVSSKNDISKGMYQVVKQRSGTTDSVPEIDLTGKYIFYAGMPYFDFTATMSMNSDVELDLLRNDEMTMDSLFTHVVYQTKAGKINRLALYTEDLDVLETSPIPHDAAFVAFYNGEKGYGLGSIRLEYDNITVDGNPSPVHNPYTKISRSKGNGRYWNRVLSDTIQRFPKGSRYHEKNAYLIFQVDTLSPEKDILYYQERLKNPLTVTVDSTN